MSNAPVSFRRAADLYSASPFLKVMLTGLSGSGKTTWAANTPRPLIVLTEQQGIASVHAANPEAVVVAVQSWLEFVEVFRRVQAAKPVTVDGGEVALDLGNGIVIQTLVVDSFTDVQRLLIDHLGGDTGGMRMEKPDEGLNDMTLQQWGRAVDVTMQVLRDQRSLKCSTLFLLLSTETVDEAGRKTVQPTITGKKLPGQMGQFFNAAGYAMQLAGRDGKTGHAIVWSAAGLPVKPGTGWPARTPCSMENPGNVSFGSLAMFSSPNLPTVPRNPGDDAQYVVDIVAKSKSEPAPGADAPSASVPSAPAATPARRPPPRR
jgi:hypothetical protein